VSPTFVVPVSKVLFPGAVPADLVPEGPVPADPVPKEEEEEFSSDIPKVAAQSELPVPPDE